MNNNDILRRVRYALNLRDRAMVSIFKDGGINLNVDEVLNLLKKQNEEGFVKCNNKTLEAFLDGLIIAKRGHQDKSEGEKATSPSTQADFNNLILKKLRIALNLKSDDMLRIFGLAGVYISESELSALFRKKGHKNYKECGDKFIRTFLKGLIIANRGERDE
jgi:uncharacterized protein YehS (DUF1456 family)